jgi:hypothetical protein
MKTKTNSRIWDARCKSGYEFPTGKLTRFLRRPIYRTCNRSTARGALLCTECHSAIVITAAAAPQGIVAEFINPFEYLAPKTN